jgi:tetratricopeptide (TPR) repeat protein
MFRAIFCCARFSCTLLLLSALGCSSLASTSLPHQAEQLIQEERYDQAIDTYQRHIAARLAASDRPDWENPHFYLLPIADLQLKTSRPHEALQSYIEAEKQGVESSLLADRYRAIATWHVENGDLQAAFEILKRYRDRDPLLFDSMLDRVGRALTAEDSRARRQHHQDTGIAR